MGTGTASARLLKHTDGSNLGNALAAHTHTGFVFDAGIRDQEENREIPNFNGSIEAMILRMADMELAAINAPVRIGRAIVLPGDQVLAKPEGVLFIPAFWPRMPSAPPSLPR